MKLLVAFLAKLFDCSLFLPTVASQAGRDNMKSEVGGSILTLKRFSLFFSTVASEAGLDNTKSEVRDSIITFIPHNMEKRNISFNNL